MEHRLKVNEGVHVEGNDQVLDIMVQRISGPSRRRSVDLLVNEQGSESRELQLTKKRPSQKVASGLQVNLVQDRYNRGRSALLLWNYSADYSFEKREYS